jgi:hypothetical protein
MIITTYKELIEYFNLFRDEKINLLVITSPPGMGKTSMILEILEEYPYAYINGHVTPLAAYEELFNGKDELVIIDDVDNIFDNKDMRILIKTISDSLETKTISYRTTKKMNKSEEDKTIPKQFQTKSKVCILLNDLNKDFIAISDRGIFIEFLPSREEILNKIADIAQINEKSLNCENANDTNLISQDIEVLSLNKPDSMLIEGDTFFIDDKTKKSHEELKMCVRKKCVYDFIIKYQDCIKNLSLRTYVKAIQFEYNEKKLIDLFFDEKYKDYIKIKEMNLSKVNDSITEWVSLGWSRATFFRVKKNLSNYKNTSVYLQSEKSKSKTKIIQS